ncbi:MAG TPA: hypothetical protein VGM39_01235 [Kofleriaceae bacterium]|jgi:hypothetical protein
MRKELCLGLALSALSACASTQLDQDGVDDSFVTTGKADGGLSSAEQAAVLRVANESSLATLKSSVHLATRTATRVVGARPFQTLAQLDAVPYVGPVALDQLLAYAEDQGYVASSDPFAPDSAGKDIATIDDLFTLLPAGERFVKLGRYNLFEQKRTCNSTTCSAWKDTTSLVFSTILKGRPNGKEVFDSLPLEGDIVLEDVGTSTAKMLSLRLQGEPDADGDRMFTTCNVGPSNEASRPTLAARGLESCDTSVVAVDELEIESHGSSGGLDSRWGIRTDNYIDWGNTPTALGYLTTSELALVANQSADYYKQTTRLAIHADFTLP